jgi:phytochrome A
MVICLQECLVIIILVFIVIRIKHQGLGVPAELMAQMFEEDQEQSDEGLGLLVSRNLLRLMNGDVRDLREAGVSTFILTAELASAPTAMGQ